MWFMAAASRSPLERVRWVQQAQRPHAVVLDRLQRVAQQRRDARVLAGHRELLVGHQLGLDHDPGRPVQHLDLVLDGHHGPLDQGHHPGAGDPDAAVAGRPPLDLPVQQPGAEVQAPLVVDEPAVAQVERLVVDQQPDDLAVGDVDDGLAGLGVAVAGLGVGQRAGLVEPVQVGAGQAVRLALVQVAAHPDVPVAEGEDRLGLGQPVQVQPDLADAPLVGPRTLTAGSPAAPSAWRLAAVAAGRPDPGAGRPGPRRPCRRRARPGPWPGRPGPRRPRSRSGPRARPPPRTARPRRRPRGPARRRAGGRRPGTCRGRACRAGAAGRWSRRRPGPRSTCPGRSRSAPAGCWRWRTPRPGAARPP